MRIRGALHVHSTLSHDGSMSVAEVAKLYGENGFHFVAMGEHSQDMDEDKVRTLSEQGIAHSGPGFLIIPGIEFSCHLAGMHVLGVGCTLLTSERDPLAVTKFIHEAGGFAVWTHPGRQGWHCSPDFLREVDAVEIWNVAYDGKYLPTLDAVRHFCNIREVHSKLLAVASHDLHYKSSFYDVALEMNVNALTRDAILENLRRGLYRIRSPFFSIDPQAQLSSGKAAFLRLFGSQLMFLRQVRSLLLGWSP